MSLVLGIVQISRCGRLHAECVHGLNACHSHLFHEAFLHARHKLALILQQLRRTLLVDQSLR